jgi:hypothetical protein
MHSRAAPAFPDPDLSAGGSDMTACLRAIPPFPFLAGAHAERPAFSIFPGLFRYLICPVRSAAASVRNKCNG